MLVQQRLPLHQEVVVSKRQFVSIQDTSFHNHNFNCYEQQGPLWVVRLLYHRGQQEVTFNTGSPLCIAYACMDTVCVGRGKLGPFGTTNGTPQLTIDISCHPGSLAHPSLSGWNEIGVGNCIPVTRVYQRRMSIAIRSLHPRLHALSLARSLRYTSTMPDYGSICSSTAQRNSVGVTYLLLPQLCPKIVQCYYQRLKTTSNCQNVLQNVLQMITRRFRDILIVSQASLQDVCSIRQLTVREYQSRSQIGNELSTQVLPLPVW